MRSLRLVPYWSVHETLGVDAHNAPLKMRTRRIPPIPCRRLELRSSPPGRRCRTGQHGPGRERPPRPRACYGRGARCVFTRWFPPSPGVAPDLSIPGGKAIRVPPTGGLMGLASGSALTGRMRSTVVREAAPMPELVRAPTGRLDFGAASRCMNFACSASRATLVPRGTILVYRHAWGALGGPIRAGGAVRDVDDPVQAWQGGTSTLARTPTRSALRPTPYPSENPAFGSLGPARRSRRRGRRGSSQRSRRLSTGRRRSSSRSIASSCRRIGTAASCRSISAK